MIIKKILRKWSVLILYELVLFVFSYLTYLNLSFAQLYIVKFYEILGIAA